MPANIAYDVLRHQYQAKYVGKPPWHGLGEVRPDDQPMTIADATKGVSDYTVDKAPLYALIDGVYREVTGWEATYRTDTGDVFAPVSKDYEVIQNATPMEMLMAIVGTKEAGFVAHAALGKGERLFAVLDLKRLTDIHIPGDPSRYDPFLVAQWWHNGGGALTFGPSLVRVDCQNMANAQLAYGEKKGMLARVIHVGDTKTAVEEAQRVLGFAEKRITDYVGLLRSLNEIAVPAPEDKWMDGFLEKLVPIPPEMDKAYGRERAREAIRHLYRDSDTMVDVPHTAYRVLQAVEEYSDHWRPLHAKPELVPARRFTTAVDGPAAELKAKAQTLLVQEFEVKVPVAVR